MIRAFVVVLLALAACSAPTATPVTHTQAAAPTTSTAPAWEASLAQFEKDNAVPASSWHPLITGREIKYGNSLWVYTSINPDADAKTAAAPICGTYAQYVLIDAKVRTTFVRASDGQQIAKCGPGA